MTDPAALRMLAQVQADIAKVTGGPLAARPVD